MTYPGHVPTLRGTFVGGTEVDYFAGLGGLRIPVHHVETPKLHVKVGLAGLQRLVHHGYARVDYLHRVTIALFNNEFRDGVIHPKGLKLRIRHHDRFLLGGSIGFAVTASDHQAGGDKSYHRHENCEPSCVNG